MSTKPMKPIKPPKKEINIKDTESLKCDDCGNFSFSLMGKLNIKDYYVCSTVKIGP